MSSIAQLPARHVEILPKAGLAPPGDPGNELDLRRIVGAVWRRKTLVAGIVALVTGVAALYVNQIRPLYVAEAIVVVEGARQQVVNIESVAKGISHDYYTNETEAAIIGSREIAAKVIDKLDLINNPLFNSTLRPPEAGLFGVVLRLIGGAPEKDGGLATASWDAMAPQDRNDMLTSQFLAGLAVVPSQRSRIISIQYVSVDPKLAARAANAAAEVYISEQLSRKGNATHRAQLWLNNRVVELRQRVIDSETRLEEFRRKSGIVRVGGINVLQEQHARLNGELISIRTKRAEAEARYGQVRSLLNSSRGAESAAAVLDSVLIVKLREQEAILQRRIAELKTQLRAAHPRMILAHNELNDLRGKIRGEVDKIVLNLSNELEIARVRQRNLEQELRALERKLDAQAAAEVRLRSLMAEVRANNQLYETVLARFKETKVVDDGLQQADARIISHATAPGAPFHPRKKLMIFAALAASLVIAAGLAVLLELMDTGFRGATQLEAVTGVPALGAVPKLRKGEIVRWPHRVVVQRPNSAFAEAIRSIRTAIMLSGHNHAPTSILVTSSVSGEGKTSTSLSLASLAARSGQRSIIIDCDLRQPKLHMALGCPLGDGLTAYLTGNADLDQVVELDTESGVYYITAGPPVAHPTDLLGSQTMLALLRGLRQQYDLVVLDTPPLLAVSDALVLVRNVDKTVFLVRWEKTRRDTVVAGIRPIIDAGADLAGVVLTQVDTAKSAPYGYGDSSHQYYQDTHAKYYSG